MAGNYAYVGCGPTSGQDTNSGLRVIDISDPRHPQTVGSFITPSSVTAVAVSGSHAFLAVEQDWTDVSAAEPRVLIIDVTNPAQPRKIGIHYGGLSPVALSILGHTCFLAAGLFGWDHIPLGAALELIDVSDIYSPKHQSSFADPPYASELTVDGNYALFGRRPGWPQGARYPESHPPSIPRLGSHRGQLRPLQFPDTWLLASAAHGMARTSSTPPFRSLTSAIETTPS